MAEYTQTQQNTAEVTNENYVYRVQYDALKDGQAVNVDPRVLATWNFKKKMSAFELSTLTPFAIIFIIGDASLGEYIQQKKIPVTYYTAEIEGYGDKGTKSTLVLLGQTKPLFGTKQSFPYISENPINIDNRQGTLGVQSFSIGYERNLTNLKGSATLVLPMLSEFETDFVATMLLSPFNILYCMYGWVDKNIPLNLPWDSNLKNNSGVWKTSIDSISPGWWQACTMYMWKRTFALQGTQYTCDLQFVQSWPNIDSGKAPYSDSVPDSKNLASNIANYNMMVGPGQTAPAILNDLANPSELMRKLSENYTERYNYINELYSNCWYKGEANFKDTFGVEIKDDKGETKKVSEVMMYPLGLIIEAMVVEQSSKNLLQQNLYARITDDRKYPDDPGNIAVTSQPTFNELPKFIFTVSNGKEIVEKILDIKSTFDIPIPKATVEAIMRKRKISTKDAIREVLNSVPDIYRVIQIGVNTIRSTGPRTISESDYKNTSFTHIIDWTEMKVDKMVVDYLKNRKLPNDSNDFIVSIGEKYSLAGDAQLEASNIGLEQLANSVVWKTLYGGNKSANSDGKTPVNQKSDDKPDILVFKTEQGKQKAEENNEIIKNLWSNEGTLDQRGYLIRSLSQVLSLNMHGTTGLLPMQAIWVKGLNNAMSGLHVILGVNHTITPENFTTNLRLGNLASMQDFGFLISEQSKKEEEQNKKQEEERKKEAEKKEAEKLKKEKEEAAKKQEDNKKKN